MEIRIVEALKGVKKELKERKKERVRWWDEECRELKKEVKRELRKWRKVRRDGSVYKERKKEFKELCKRKKKKENRRWEKKRRKQSENRRSER